MVTEKITNHVEVDVEVSHFRIIYFYTSQQERKKNYLVFQPIKPEPPNPPCTPEEVELPPPPVISRPEKTKSIVITLNIP